MSFRRISPLAVTALISTLSVAGAADPTPRLTALEALGQQNMNSLTSHARMGGPEGISISELPAADAYCQAKKVDAIWAIRAGSKAPVIQFDLAHPSHIPGVPGMRPFVSHGPISKSPGSNRRRSGPGVYAPYPQITLKNSAAAPPAVANPAPATQADVAANLSKPVLSTTFQRRPDTPGAPNKL